MFCDPAGPFGERLPFAPGFPLRASAPDPHRAGSGCLLWIDDEITPDDGAVRLLGLEGVQVECAVSGAEGVRKARTGRHDAIILDQRMPDMSGLTALEQMRSEGVSIPVLVLTGYPDLDVAVAAGRLGAWDFKPKTLLLEDGWTAVVHALVEAGRRAQTARAPVSDRREESDAGEREHLKDLLEELERLGAREANATRAEVVRVLLRAVADRVLTTPVFVACCVAFGCTVTSSSSTGAAHLATQAADLISRTAGKPRGRWPRVVQDVIAALENRVNDRVRPSEDDIAADSDIDGSYLGRRIHASTGMRFREWRKALVMRLAIPEIVTTEEQFAQIAYGLHYEHPTQFTREFRELFDVTPTEFRQLWGSLMTD